MSKTIITVIVAVIIVAAVSYGFYAYTQPAVAPTMTNVTTNTNVVPNNTVNSNRLASNATNVVETTQIFLVALEDNGKSGAKVGCGDSLVPVDVEINRYGPSDALATEEQKIQYAVENLLQIKDAKYGQSGLYSALYQSDLQVETVTMDNGIATVALTGNVTSGGTCDDPRIQEQLVETVKAQDDTITTVNVTIDGVALSKVLSASGQ